MTPRFAFDGLMGTPYSDSVLVSILTTEFWSLLSLSSTADNFFASAGEGATYGEKIPLSMQQEYLTKEDKKRPQLFADEKSRKKHLKSFSNYDEFLKSLKMKIFLKKATIKDVPRVTQLINKVNQFNLTVKRSNEEKVLSLLSTKDCIYTIRLEDKFGDFGTVGVIIFKYQKQGVWEIDNFLLSCRALGRKVENLSLSYILNILQKENNEKVIGSFTPGDKNEQTKDFYKNMGFSFNKEIEKWVWELNKNKSENFNLAEVSYFE